MSLDTYINCFEGCNMRHLEALAMLGLAIEVNVENCEKNRFKKIVMRLYDGRTISSMCYFEEEVEQSIRIINTYINIAKKNNAIGKLKIVEETKIEE
ncbi:MAG: hypothetical protein QXE81_02545 [Desulfurococcaceae archaeon]